MNCKFCHKNRKLIKAHVIPQAFFRELTGKKRPSLLITDTIGTFPKRSPIGQYDKQILCGDCEPQFGDWDNYAQDFLLRENGFQEIKKGGEGVVGYAVDQFDYEKLKLFFISLLWRASVSQLPFYKNVNLGPYESVAYEHIKTRDPGEEDTFSISLIKYSDPIGKAIIEPIPARWFNVNYYRFCLTGYVAAIKVDKRPAPDYMGRLRLNRNKPLFIAIREMPNEMELQLIFRAVKQMGK